LTDTIIDELTQRPAVQACPDVQVIPQPPQLLTLLVVLVSQPLPARPSQLPKPAAQVMPHEPPAQLGVPLLPLHTLPQLPQLARFSAVPVSQPLPASPSQLPKPGLHEATPHAPPEQDGAPLGVLQTTPQAPQLVVADRLASQPSPAAPLQSAKLVLQRNPHARAAQKLVAPARVGQASPQPLQLPGSKVVLVHTPEQLLRPAPQVTVHTPAEQT